jgi:putative ABC transport system ATP-binding protein
MKLEDGSPSPPLIRLQGVSKDYRKGTLTVPVLDRLDLSFRRGEFVALMGRSGSGKTTLLNLVAGLDRPSAGGVVVDGVAIDRLGRREMSAWRARHIGLIFQFYNLLPALTAAQNVELPLLLYRLPAAQRRERVHRALDAVRLLDRMTHLPSELSGGQQQRVAIARALVADPSILLCDEPTGDLDQNNASRIMEILTILNTDFAKTILVATHDPKVAACANRTLRLDELRATVGERA